MVKNEESVMAMYKKLLEVGWRDTLPSHDITDCKLLRRMVTFFVEMCENILESNSNRKKTRMPLPCWQLRMAHIRKHPLSHQPNMTYISHEEKKRKRGVKCRLAVSAMFVVAV